MFGLFIVLVAAGILLGWMCIMGAVAWLLERLIDMYERRHGRA